MFALARTCTSSQAFLIVLPAQVIETRSDPSTPAPLRTEMVAVAVKVGQLLGELSFPRRNTKSAAEIAAWSPLPSRSIMMPLMPRV